MALHHRERPVLGTHLLLLNAVAARLSPGQMSLQGLVLTGLRSGLLAIVEVERRGLLLLDVRRFVVQEVMEFRPVGYWVVVFSIRALFVGHGDSLENARTRHVVVLGLLKERNRLGLEVRQLWLPLRFLLRVLRPALASHGHHRAGQRLLVLLVFHGRRSRSFLLLRLVQFEFWTLFFMVLLHLLK